MLGELFGKLKDKVTGLFTKKDNTIQAIENFTKEGELSPGLWVLKGNPIPGDKLAAMKESLKRKPLFADGEKIEVLDVYNAGDYGCVKIRLYNPLPLVAIAAIAIAIATPIAIFGIGWTIQKAEKVVTNPLPIIGIALITIPIILAKVKAFR